MAEGDVKDFKVQYSAAAAKGVVEKITKELEDAKTAHDAAINAWKIVKSKFTLSASSQAKLDSIDEAGGLDETEFNKVVQSLENMIKGVENIDTSWQNVSTEIDSAINTYLNKA